MKVGITGTFDVENYGDLMFPLIAEHELRQRIGQIEMVRYSYRQKIAGSWPYSVAPLGQIETDLTSLAGLLIGGGHIVRFDKMIAEGYLPTNATIHHPTGYWLGAALAAISGHVPVLWNAPSASPNTPVWARPIMAAAFDMSDYVSMRDESSTEELRRAGFAGSCSIVPDSVFNLSKLLPLDEAVLRAQPLLEAAGISKPYIVVQANATLLPMVESLRDHPLTKHYDILVLPIGPILGDRSSHIRDEVPSAKALGFWPEPLDLAALIASSSGSAAVSLHLTISTLSYGLPVLRFADSLHGKYALAKTSENVFLFDATTRTLPDAFIQQLGMPRLCSFVANAQSALDAHWHSIADVLRNEKRPDAGSTLAPYTAWNKMIAGAERQSEQDANEIAVQKEALEGRIADGEAAIGAMHEAHRQHVANVQAEAQAVLDEHRQHIANMEANALAVAHAHSQHIADKDRAHQQRIADIGADARKMQTANEALVRDLIASNVMQLDALRAQLSKEAVERAQLATVVAGRDEQIAAMLRSHSWRMTSALRVTTNLARAMRDKLRGSPATSQSATVSAAEQSAALSATEQSPTVPGTASTASLDGESSTFDAAFYLKLYEDVARSGADPYRHYVDHGRAEKRLGSPPKIELHINSAMLRDDRDFVLVVCHEASRTGAPILGWNICADLSKRHNVVSLLLDGGEITEYFEQSSAVVGGPFEAHERSPQVLAFIVEDLCKKYDFKFAIVNSIAARATLHPLAEKYVPSVLLIHEFYKFHCTRDELIDTLSWAGSVVFSASVVQNSAITERTHSAINSSYIIPQGKSVIPSKTAGVEVDQAEVNELVSQILPVDPMADKPFIVLGAGTIEYRKGVDLFVATALEIKRLAPDSNILMVWVGRTVHVEPYRQYAEFVIEQVKSSGLENRLKMVNETPYLDAIYDLVDLCFISSRLDPLPNIAIDAMMNGTPVISFENATGISEILASHTATADCVLPFLSVDAAAQRIIAMSMAGAQLAELGQHVKSIALDAFDMEKYVAKLEDLATNVGSSAQLLADEARLKSGSEFVADFYVSPNESLDRDLAIKTFVKQSQGQIYIRKPSPGFNPDCYARSKHLSKQDANAFVHYLDADKPSGPWQEPLIDLARSTALPRPALRIAVHFHAFYLDLVPDMLARLSSNDLSPDLLFSVTSEKAADELRIVLEKHHQIAHAIRVVPNRGRDVGPFFTEFQSDLQKYDVVGHFHTKKSPHVMAGSRLVKDWVDFLMENLIGGRYQSARAIISAFSQDEKLGLVFADDPHLIGWDKNRPFAERLANRLGLGDIQDGFFPFPVGTMFWARPQALRPLFDANLQWSDYPSEPVPIDGTLLHAIERLIPSVVEHTGYTRMVTYAEGVNR
ncbi:rhamnan synthesis F family protein [Caballeronia sp. 15711]|uniref:rhamnan synthesis F family protein n=1 Tax=Caballeronia sp. 15711 TaxID=3391029 RepID=UPI0039E67A42